MERIKAAIPNPTAAHIACYNATPLERTFSVQLNVALYACNPGLIHLGSKSNSRDIFRAGGVPMPDGLEYLWDKPDIFKGVATLEQRNPNLRRAAIKLNDGFSGEGNAIFDFSPDHNNLSEKALRQKLTTNLPQHIRVEAPGETWPQFRDEFFEMQGVVECWIDGDEKRSPSVQSRINPLGQVNIVSTHDQVYYSGISTPRKFNEFVPTGFAKKRPSSEQWT